MRRGLAPLELVLWLPILLFVAALMVNLGTSTAWRIRGEIVARDAAWRTRWPRTGENEPRPLQRVWPADAAMEIRDDDQIAQLDHLDINRPVVRGPLPNGFVVRDVLLPMQGAYRGSAEIDRPFPLLRNLGAMFDRGETRRLLRDRRLGEFNSGEIRHPLLDRRWSCAEMRMYANVQRRTLVLYEMPKTDPALPQAFIDTILDMLASADFAALRVLDRDPDMLRYRGRYRDFHPRINRNMCSADREQVHEEQVERLVDHLDDDGEVELGEISHLPRTMARTFRDMYEQRLEDIQQGGQAGLQAEISQLESYIEQLEAYLDRMNSIEAELESAFRLTL